MPYGALIAGMARVKNLGVKRVDCLAGDTTPRCCSLQACVALVANGHDVDPFYLVL